ncbi:nuclease-related domain-containing protein [Paenibacillus cellulositrophicus]|uniref:nuclease-related domain-containing protein n=1 Tax=Paenibacillus cellulositrophicus TaxID=562959 RepID=UPI003D95CFB2
MAIIYPENPSPRTAGEWGVIDLLCNSLDDTWVIFYEPLIEDIRPDIVLYSPFHGIIVVEVKDWIGKTVKLLAPDHWVINTQMGDKRVTSPLKQVSEYSFKLMNYFSKHKELIHSEGRHQGKLIFPVAHLCVFTRMSPSEIEDLKITSVIPVKSILNQEDLNKGEALIVKITKLITEIFTIDPLPIEVSSIVKQLLYPEYIVQEYVQQSFTPNILKGFPSLVDEVLFICTELRDCNRNNINKKVVVYYDSDRFLTKRRISEEIKLIFEDMGLLLSSNGGFIELLSLNNEEALMDDYEWSQVFVVDFNHIQWNTKKEVFLDQLSKKTPGDNFICTYHY